jgi:hypothetical protein
MMSERRYRAEGEPCRTFSEGLLLTTSANPPPSIEDRDAEGVWFTDLRDPLAANTLLTPSSSIYSNRRFAKSGLSYLIKAAARRRAHYEIQVVSTPLRKGGTKSTTVSWALPTTFAFYKRLGRGSRSTVMRTTSSTAIA